MAATLEDVRVILADDHAVVRTGFRMLLEGSGATVVAEAGSGEGALREFAAHRPDLLVMDVAMPGLGGLGALERLLAHHPSARVLMLSAHDDPQVPTRALKAGATGYLSKGSPPFELLRAVAAVARGERYVDPDLATHLVLAQLGKGSDPIDALTEKEFEMFLQFASGRDAKQIAHAHSISPSTVGTHLYHIKQKLRAANAAQLALIAVRAGLIDA